MKSTRFATLCVALGLVSFLTLNSRAAVYNDASNDLFDNGFSNLDITSVEVTNTATAITIAVTVRGFQNWTKYLIGIRTAAASVSSTTGNAWGRNGTYSEGINFQIASWVDGGGGVQFVRFTGGAWDWSSTSGAAIDMTQSGSNKISWTVSLASLGLGTGDTFKFDVGTTGGGGGDPFVDMASRSDPSTSGWGTASTGGPMLSYTVEAILDFDGDGIADATDTDDDNDGLPDSVETGTGIWSSSSDSGTNPKSVDTDGDGLNDGVETNTGTYVGVTDTGSNPLVADDYDRDMLPDFHDTDDDNDNLADTVETNTGNWSVPRTPARIPGTPTRMAMG